MTTVLNLSLSRAVATAMASKHGVNLITPDSDDVEVRAIRLAISAATPLTVLEVESRISAYIPELAEDVLAALPAPMREALGPAFPAILMGGNVWGDKDLLPGVVSHEIGHHLREKAARTKAGVIGSVLWNGAYLLHPMVRIAEESTCYSCDVTAAVILRGETPHDAAARALESLRTIYRSDDTSLKIARGVLASVAASLTRFQLPGVKTPLQGTLQALRAGGVDFGPWNDAIGVAA